MTPMFFKMNIALKLTFLVGLVVSPLSADPQPLVKGLEFATSFQILPNGQFLIAEKKGLILLASQDGAVQTWMDLTSSTFTDGEAGLLSLALDPEFSENGYVYASQSADVDGKKSFRLLRLVQENGHGTLNRVLWDGLPAGTEEVGGIVRYGPDGCLYWGVGAGGDDKVAQDPSSLRGALLRIYPDGTIPSDNPIAGSPVWAWGLRDPRGMAWNTSNGQIYGLDRGPKVVQGTMDELNLLEADHNYGWPLVRGREEREGVTTPIIYCNSGHAWLPGGAAFVAGGPWNDSLLFAGAGEGILYRLAFDKRYPRKIDFYEELINGALGPLADVQQGTDQVIYVLARDGVFSLPEKD